MHRAHVHVTAGFGQYEVTVEPISPETTNDEIEKRAIARVLGDHFRSRPNKLSATVTHRTDPEGREALHAYWSAKG